MLPVVPMGVRILLKRVRILLKGIRILLKGVRVLNGVGQYSVVMELGFWAILGLSPV